MMTNMMPATTIGNRSMKMIKMIININTVMTPTLVTMSMMRNIIMIKTKKKVSLHREQSTPLSATGHAEGGWGGG